MANKTVCIEREYGSNGKKVAEWLSKSTGIECYDKNALKEVAVKYNLLQEEVVAGEEGEQKVFAEAIKFLAEKRSCIFVGTCAAYILQDKPRNLNVFIKADIESRILWVMDSDHADRDQAASIIEEMDKGRREYRARHAMTEAGEPVSYDIVVTSSKFGIEGTAELIRSCLSRI